ncbi:nitronate monooxygenase family protein [Thalassobacillus sp. C254]|uniref:NAD(P)H-dependent flavin oxidoreductase n=1 Tax=Thalassobacillus sp. C254 TaxID=1225341 RepID=UPI0006D205D8|nr:nitronate monooxygenase [Thalassobacillus sp. C254]
MTKISADFINDLQLPAIMAPMFLVSNPKMVIEGCKNGIIGSFPALNARTGSIFSQWMSEIKTELEKEKENETAPEIAPWAVNFIANKKANKRYDEDLTLIREFQPPIVITSLGDPAPVIDIVHEYGGLVFTDVIDVFYARKAAEKGTDGLILVCNGAGGHAGTYHPMAFIKEVKKFFHGITILAGSISEGEDLVAAEAMGADLSYIGTKFIAASESSAPSEYKQMLIDSTMDDIVYTDVFSGVNANYLVPSIENKGIKMSELQQSSQGKNLHHLSDAKAWKDIWSAGHGVGSINKIEGVQEIVTDLKNGYERTLKKLTKKVKAGEE